MPSLAMLLHIVLTMTDYVIVFNMYLKIYVTRQFQPKIYLARHFVRHSKKVIIVSGVHMCVYMHMRVCMHVCACVCVYVHVGDESLCSCMYVCVH